MRERTESDFKAAAEDLARLGRKYLEAGRELINDWRMQMNRNRERQGRSWQQEQRPGPRDRDFDREPSQMRSGFQRDAGPAYRSRPGSHEDARYEDYSRRQRDRYGVEAEALAGSAYEAGYADRPYYTPDYARGGLEGGYGGPGGYAPRSGYEAGYGGEEFRSGYGGSDYQTDNRYATGYGELRTSRATGERRYEGGYRGMGPKDYARSDERIREELCERLSEADDIDASEISVSVRNGVAVLQGEVTDRWMKYRAEDLADSCAGVKDVQNTLRIDREAARSRFSPTGKSQQQAQRAYEQDIERRESADRVEGSRH